ncbi:uncharacterized protein LOC129587479 [Paramacrobiotus metropolitanus]|uniref:uncharacterized protein LOC129587479 n=1 Tax=Paramacrobiotus metropolitanus TaxID=2943436 RepID=UPI002445C029|nr:uncharacterized protein LOC129587479 [Paramacrobiotus metropolitanus]
MALDRKSWNEFAAAYKTFIRNCDLAERNRFPVFELEISWEKVDVKMPWREKKPAHLSFVPSLSSGPPDHRELTGDPDSGQMIRYFKAPWLDVQWYLDLELLPVIDDGTMSYQFRIPFSQAQSTAAVSTAPSADEAGPSQPAGGKMERLKDFKEGIARRLRGERSSENRRSLLNTLQRDTKDPDCVLLAACRWEGRAMDAFTILGAKVSVGSLDVVGREPFQMHETGPASFVLDSAHAAHWQHPHEHGSRHGSLYGLKKRNDWLNSYQVFSRNMNAAADDITTTVTLTLTIQMNELSIPKMGFPFDRLGMADNELFEATLESLRKPLEGSVHVRGWHDDDYYVPQEILSSSSEYFRTFLTDNWMHDTPGKETIIFPQVPPFTENPHIVPEILFFLVQKSVVPNLTEDYADLMVAADVLDMPELMEVASISMLSMINLENVTETIRFSWDRRADLLFRAALLYLKSNYDRVWLNDRDDLADLGQTLSHPNFLEAFTMVRYK